MEESTLFKALLSLTLLFACLPARTSAQSPTRQPVPPVSTQPRTSLQWTEMRGKRTQVFIDLHVKRQSTYRGITSGFAPTFMVQLPGDGSADLLEYQGSGDDWKWVPVPSHISLTHPSAGIDHIEFDLAPLAQGKDFTVVFRSLDDAWTPVASSKVLSWHPN